MDKKTIIGIIVLVSSFYVLDFIADVSTIIRWVVSGVVFLLFNIFWSRVIEKKSD